jgi:hypothetical protein
MLSATHVWVTPNVTFLVIVVALAALAILPIWAIASAVASPDALWNRAEISKPKWVISLVASFVLFSPLSLVLGVIYFARVRPQIRMQ